MRGKPSVRYLIIFNRMCTDDLLIEKQKGQSNVYNCRRNRAKQYLGPRRDFAGCRSHANIIIIINNNIIKSCWDTMRPARYIYAFQRFIIFFFFSRDISRAYYFVKTVHARKWIRTRVILYIFQYVHQVRTFRCRKLLLLLWGLLTVQLIITILFLFALWL